MSFRHPCPTEAELRSLAHRPVLEKWEFIQLVQGFCPNRRIGKGDVYYLEGIAEYVDKINCAVRVGKLSFPIKPTPAAIWCAENDVPLPEEFASETLDDLFVLARPKQKIIPTGELIRGSESDQMTKHYKPNEKKRGRKSKKSEPAICGIESKVCKLARGICIEHIKKHGIKPRKKEINFGLASLLVRAEVDVDRAYSYAQLMTTREEIAAKRFYRRSVQENIEFST